jgi:Leucine-rich repeat (LRR) protein
MVIRVPQVSQITSILANNNISLQQNKAGAMGGASRKNEDTVKAGENAKKMVINKQTTTLFLQNNQIRTLAGDKPENGLYNVL